MKSDFQLDTLAARRYAELKSEPGAKEINGKLHVPHDDYGFTAVYQLQGQCIEVILLLPKGDIIDRLLVTLHMEAVLSGL